MNLFFGVSDGVGISARNLPSSHQGGYLIWKAADVKVKKNRQRATHKTAHSLEETGILRFFKLEKSVHLSRFLK